MIYLLRGGPPPGPAIAMVGKEEMRLIEGNEA